MKMKKFISKMMPLALLVLALSLVSVAVSASGVTITDKGYSNGAVTVEVTPLASEQVVILAVEGAAVTITGDAVTDATAAATYLTGQAADTETLEGKITYVDQSAATTASPASFTFIPRDTNGTTDTQITVFASSASATEVTPLVIDLVEKYTVTFVGVDGKTTEEYTAGYAIDNIVKPTKQGYTFTGWTSSVESATTITQDMTLTANWQKHFTVTSDKGICVEEDETKTGAISVTAKFDADEVNSVSQYGFYVYRTGGSMDENKRVTVEANVKALTADGFYTIVYNIPEANFNDDVIIMPYAVTDEAVYYGTIDSYNMSGVTKEIGTKAQLEASLGE